MKETKRSYLDCEIKEWTRVHERNIYILILTRRNMRRRAKKTEIKSSLEQNS